jgi:hypothetical protein
MYETVFTALVSVQGNRRHQTQIKSKRSLHVTKGSSSKKGGGVWY